MWIWGWGILYCSPCICSVRGRGCRMLHPNSNPHAAPMMARTPSTPKDFITQDSGARLILDIQSTKAAAVSPHQLVFVLQTITATSPSALETDAAFPIRAVPTPRAHLVLLHHVHGSDCFRNGITQRPVRRRAASHIVVQPRPRRRRGNEQKRRA